MGYIYAREGLTKEEKVLTTTTALAAMGGCENELVIHFNTAINVNINLQKIINPLIQIIPDAGFPRVINAVNICKKVFDNRGIKYVADK